MVSISKKKREEIKQMFGGRCAYCGCVLGDKWHVDHVKPILRRGTYDEKLLPNGRLTLVFKPTGEMDRPENDRYDNLFPSCIPCNIHKSGSSMEGFRRALTDHIKQLNKQSNYSIYRHAKRFGLVTEIEKKVVFWFEQCAGVEV